MAGDILVARPFGMVLTLVGSALFVVSLPFTALGGNVSEAADVLVVGPAKETFVRCLGCTSSGRYSDPNDRPLGVNLLRLVVGPIDPERFGDDRIDELRYVAAQ